MTLRPTRYTYLALGGRRRGYTLIEILVALALTLILMTVVTRVFATVGDGIRKSRSALEQFDRLRTAVAQAERRLELHHGPR